MQPAADAPPLRPDWADLSHIERALSLDAYRADCAAREGHSLPWSWRRLAEQLAADGLLAQTAVFHLAKLAALPEPARALLLTVRGGSLTTLIRHLRDLPAPPGEMLARVRRAVVEAEDAAERFRDPARARAARRDQRDQRAGVPALASADDATPSSTHTILFERTLGPIGTVAPTITIRLQTAGTGSASRVAPRLLAACLERASLELEDAARLVRRHADETAAPDRDASHRPR